MLAIARLLNIQLDFYGTQSSRSPTFPEQLSRLDRIYDPRITIPILVYNGAIFNVKWVCLEGRGPIDSPGCVFFITHGHGYPDIFKGVWDLSKQAVYGSQALREEFVDAILDRVAIAEVGYPYVGVALPYALDTALALLQPCRIPGQVDMDEAAEALQIEPFRGGVGTEEDLDPALGYP